MCSSDLTELHGGRVTARNRSGGGLEIDLTLPLGLSEAAAA